MYLVKTDECAEFVTNIHMMKSYFTAVDSTFYRI